MASYPIRLFGDPVLKQRATEVTDVDGKPLALFYCDYFKRDNKNGGAWMSAFVRPSRLLGELPAVYNGANEACVADFLTGRIGLPRIVDTVARILSEHDVARADVTTVADVLAVDGWARRRARELNT